MKRMSGAQFVAMDQERCQRSRPELRFLAAKPDRVIHDGDTVTLGDVTMTAHLTPGHTRGCTTWTTVVRDGGKRYNVVFVGSASVLPSYQLIDRPNIPATYPGIQQDYERTFRVLRSLPCDVFLASHGSFYSLADKRGVLSTNPAQNPFIDPCGISGVHPGRGGGLPEGAGKTEQARAACSIAPRIKQAARCGGAAEESRARFPATGTGAKTRGGVRCTARFCGSGGSRRFVGSAAPAAGRSWASA